VGGGAAGMHHTLGDALVIEVHHLLAEMVILHQGRATRPGLQRVIGVVEADTLRGREVRTRLRPRIIRGAGRLTRR